MANSNITKKALAQSLKELGSAKILDKITVADITEHCGVNRQTFYYHFDDKYELLNWIYTEELFKPLTKDMNFFNWGDKLIELFKYMKNMKSFFMNTIKSSNNFFADYMNRVLVELLHKAIKDLDLYNHLEEREKDIYARFFAYGLTGVIVDWTMMGMKIDEVELSMTLQKMIINTEKIGHEFYMQRKKEAEAK